MVDRKFSQARIPVIGANEIPRIQFSSGAAKSLEQFSRNMFSLSNQFEDQLDQTAQAEAKNEGALAGSTGTMPDLRTYETIRGRAYNQSAIETFVTTLDTNSILKVQELTTKYPNDPASLQKGLEDYSRGVTDELQKTYPPAAATFKQRMLLRSMPVVEAAKDTAAKLSRDQADAALVTNQAALKAEIKTYAGDLFSDNPQRSSAAVAAIGAVQDDYLRIYAAKDPATGRPLYTAEEQAKAKVKFYSDVMEDASLSWFDGQKDKSAAYLKFTSPDFAINLTKPGNEGVKFIDDTAGKIRSKPISPTVRSQLATAAAATEDGLSIEIVSGGQNPLGVGGPRTGSERHDNGGAADVRLVRNGKPILPGQDKALYAKFMENAAAAGATGIGHYAWGIHVGGGTQAAWGPNTKSDTLDPEFGAAIQRGWAGPKLDGKPVNTKIDIRKSLPSNVLDRIDSEMRARISFSNQQADRQEKIQEKQVKKEQDSSEFELINRVYNAGKTDPESGQATQPLSAGEVAVSVRNGWISADKGAMITKALATEKPTRSDQPFYRDVQARIEAGEDVSTLILQNVDKLSEDDATRFLSTNYSRNVSNEGKLTPEQNFHLDQLTKLLTPDGVLAKLDEGKQQRRYEALDEYRQRVKSGENPRDVADDVRNRAVLDLNQIDVTALGGLLRPRFSVRDTSHEMQNRIDIEQSGRALAKAWQDQRISEPEFREQLKQLRKFDDIQKSLDAMPAPNSKTKAKK